MDIHEMAIEFYNSEKYHLCKELPDRTIDWRFEPFSIVYGKLNEDVDEIEIHLHLSSKENKRIFEGYQKVPVEKSAFAAKFSLEQKLSELPEQATIIVECDAMVKTITQKLECARLSGRVEDFSGNALKGAIILLGKRRGWTEEFDGGMAITDDNGHYDFYLPKGLYRQNWAITEDILTSTLENYFYELTLEKDTVLNFKIDQAEIAKLAVTPVDDNHMFALRFVCWTINTSCLPSYEALKRGETSDLSNFSDPRFMPHLKQDEVEVQVNGIPVQIIAFEPVPVQCKTGELTPGWYIEAVLPSAIGRGQHVLTVVVHHRSQDPDGNEMIEHGQAQYFSLMFP